MRILSSYEAAWPCSSKAITTAAAPYLRIVAACSRNLVSPSFSEIEFTMPLPCMPLSPASITSHFEESIMKGTLATSGSLDRYCRKRVIAVTPSIMPSSMQMSRTLAPFSTCWRAILTAPSYLPSLMSLANLGDPATLVRSPMTMKTPGCCVKGCAPERRSGLIFVAGARFPLSSKLALLSRSSGVRIHNSRCPELSWRQVFQRFGDGCDVLRCVATAATSDVNQPSLRELAEITRHVLRPEIESGFRQRIRQPRIRIARNRHVCLLGELLQKRIHKVGTERTVQTHRKRLHMLHRIPECLNRLSRDHRLAASTHGRRNHDRQLLTFLIEHFPNGNQRTLGI